MTPEQARELLDGTVPGPWLCDKDGDEYEFLIGTEDFGIITEANSEADGRLIAAAPALAHLVANMHYEYAVQFKHGEVWEYENSAFNDRSPVDDLCSEDPSVSFWWDCVEDAQREAARIYVTPTRIVRRLVSEPEVVE